jgi:hypothetical protein
LNTLNPGAVIVSFRNAPVFDFMNPSERINQVILSNLYNDQPFKAIPESTVARHAIWESIRRRIKTRRSLSKHTRNWISTWGRHRLIRSKRSAARRAMPDSIARRVSECGAHAA